MATKLPDPVAVRETYRQDPVAFIKKAFGEDVVGKQREILAALARPGVTEVHVRSCHASGKTHTCARAVAWWLGCYPNDSIVLTTAPIWSQVEQQLWREIRDGYVKAKTDLGGRITTVQWEFGPKWYARGIATSADTAVNIQGYHAAHVLVIVDEADGVPQTIWDAVDGLTTSAHVVVLAIGNPINAQSAWKKRHDKALGDPRKVVIKIAAEDVLPFSDTGKYPFLVQRSWVEDKANPLTGWGPTSALYIAKVLAEWPDQGVDTVIPISWLQRARHKTVPRGPRAIGVDVARGGVNRTVRTMVEGNQLVWTRATSKEDTMQSAGRVFADIEQYGPVATAVDDSGVGGGVTDRLKQMGKSITPVNNGASALDSTRFANRGSEMWWQLRQAFEGDYIGLLSDDMAAVDELIEELNRAKYQTDAQGRIRVDKYGLDRGRTVKSMTDEEVSWRSPDRADSFVLAWNAIAKRLPNRPVVKESEVQQEIREALEERMNAGRDGWTM